MNDWQGWVLVWGILGLLAIGMGGVLYAIYRSQLIYEASMKRIATDHTAAKIEEGEDLK